ncbi:C-AMP-responsive-element binding protein omega, putative, partial [Ixodes scapularis]
AQRLTGARPSQVVPSSTTQALAVQQPGGGVSIVHVSIPNQQMHVQSVIQPNQQSVIQAAGGAALQTVGTRWQLQAARSSAAMVTGEDEPKKRRELLARRPSYRRILNELSSTEAQGAVASLTEEAKEEQEDDPDGTITVAGTQYHTAAGLLKVVPASAIQLATVTQEGSLQGLQTLTMTNAGSAATAGTIVQYAQGQDGQFFVPGGQVVLGNSLCGRGPAEQSVYCPTSAPRKISGENLASPQSLAEEASRKRELRLLKNRDAAKECRRKKKEYIKCLENRVAVLENQNKALIDELKSLKELYCQKNE